MACPTQAQDADSIINRLIDAIGGKERLANFNNIQREGIMEVMGREIRVKEITQHNFATRLDMNLAGINGYVLSGLEKGWVYMPYLGQTKPEPIPDEEVKASIFELDLQGSFFNYQAKGHKVALLGIEEIEGISCFKLQITLKNGGIQELFIDTKSFLILREIRRRTGVEKETERITDMYDYRWVEGINLPHSISNGNNSTMKYSNIRINVPVDKSLFEINK